VTEEKSKYALAKVQTVFLTKCSTFIGPKEATLNGTTLIRREGFLWQKKFSLETI
jgi:hypothetical protein